LKIDAELMPGSIEEVPRLAEGAEQAGFDCVWANETKHDPFLQLALAAQTTKRIQLGTSVALAFTRSPTTLAYASWDLQSLSAGRLILGLGTQVKGHIERRFGMRWESPAPKMRDVVRAVRAVWDSWQSGKKLEYNGRYFRIDLMTPFFDPGPVGRPGIPIFIAAVNRRMCGLAGEVADGLHVHPLHTLRYLKQVEIPAVERGLRSSRRQRESFTVAVSTFAAGGDSEEGVKRVREFYRSQVAFYASTRTYRPVMEEHGWGNVCDELHSLSTSGDWEKMGTLISDEMLDEFVVCGRWGELGEAVKKKYTGLADRVRLYMPFDGGDGWSSLVRGFRDAQ
jgi:probable F420-dependent oxidoreductase